MKSYLSFLFICFTGLLLAGSDSGRADDLSDGEIKRKIIQESIDEYEGNCPCPYNVAANGSECGERSAYSRQGGEEPICYPRDVSPQMIREYRARHNTND